MKLKIQQRRPRTVEQLDSNSKVLQLGSSVPRHLWTVVKRRVEMSFSWSGGQLPLKQWIQRYSVKSRRTSKSDKLEETGLRTKRGCCDGVTFGFYLLFHSTSFTAYWFLRIAVSTIRR